jgi:integrase
VNQHKESNGSKQFLEPEELSRLLKELPEHLRDIAACAVATGLRMSNVLGMRWKWVNLPARRVTVPAELTKNGEPITLPLNDLAYVDRAAGRQARGVRVHVRGQAGDSRLEHGRYGALERAGLTGVRFHDLRHTSASYLAQNGASDRELQELGAWKSLATVRRYAHLRAAHLAPAAGLINRVLSPDRLLTVAEG